MKINEMPKQDIVELLVLTIKLTDALRVSHMEHSHNERCAECVLIDRAQAVIERHGKGRAS